MNFLEKLPRSFYNRDTIIVAKELLGKYLVHLHGGAERIGRIVEVEAYLGPHDLAAHSSKGLTNRTKIMFGPPGHAYVYMIYGMYYCLNAVAGEEGTGQAILIRALEPVEGKALMQKRRGTKDMKLLCNGPGKLTQALAIDISFNSLPLFSDPVQIWSSDSLPGFEIIGDDDIIRTTRVGISQAKDLLLRFYIKGNPYISKK